MNVRDARGIAVRYSKLAHEIKYEWRRDLGHPVDPDRRASIQIVLSSRNLAYDVLVRNQEWPYCLAIVDADPLLYRDIGSLMYFGGHNTFGALDAYQSLAVEWFEVP